jgi:hypothetical protein
MVKGHRIYIEGPDLAGKTTLARNTSYKFCNEVQDRSFISAFVYDQALRRGKLISETEFEDWCNKFLNNNETHVAILIPDEKTLEKRYSERGDSLSLEEIMKVRAMYVAVYEKFMKERGNVSRVSYGDYDFREYSDCDELIDCLVGTETFSYKIKNDIEELRLLVIEKPVLGYDFRYRFEDCAQLGEVARSFFSENRSDIEIDHNDYYAIHGLILDKLHYCKSILGDRRLIAHTDMCISLFHFQLEDNKVVVNWVIRSSDVKNKLVSDMCYMLEETFLVFGNIIGRIIIGEVPLGVGSFPIEFNVRILNAHNVEVKNAK